MYENHEKDEVIFCIEYVRGDIRYRCHPNFCNNGHYYDWMLVHYDGGNDFTSKLIACLSRKFNDFEGYQLVVQEANSKTNESSILFQDYSFFPKLTIIDANAVNGPCFVIESHKSKKIVCLAKEKELLAEAFTEVYAQNS